MIPFRLLALAAIFALPFTLRAEAADARSDFAPRIVVLGSSTAARAGARPPSMAWVDRYETYLKANWPGSEVINRAVGGYTTYHLMPTGFVPPEGRPSPVADRNITYALSLNPDAIIINLPSNDAGSGVSVENQIANYLVIAGLAKDAGVPLWVTTTAPRKAYTTEKITNQLAVREWTLETFGDRAIEVYKPLADTTNRLDTSVDSGDGVHLNNLGHAIVFRRVVEAGIPYALMETSEAATPKHRTVAVRE